MEQGCLVSVPIDRTKLTQLVASVFEPPPPDPSLLSWFDRGLLDSIRATVGRFR